jgi:hypothetical protein
MCGTAERERGYGKEPKITNDHETLPKLKAVIDRKSGYR